MKWIDQGSYLELFPPKEFNFKECLVFLGRSKQEVLHQIREESVYKLLKINGETLLIKIGGNQNSIQVEFPISAPSKSARKKVAAYVWKWFDLDQELENFYLMACKDRILQQIVQQYYGLRIICIPDLFEALTWAIIGQQINLPFAYTLKKRFVEHFGESLTFNGHTFWLFPEFQRIAMLDIDDLKRLQFTSRKAEYIIGVAKAMESGKLTKAALLKQQEYQLVHKSLMAIRGVGAWTADYVMMKCLQFSSAFPIADVGLHNAIKIQLGLERKPTIEEIEEMTIHWEGWQAYATFYLWRSLYE
ncbi:DNA-3-methyladenine glycosylase [Bacillus sp. SA1-12]|uniref:DNA-3-methyladenine glycosylase family protein n=1 Tax=Bacillus sp. SA1-12 TaxID=1455638 RepID=UPI0006270D25|nr:DNA-3-methyladenine glycosylase [Bacillus sp. SA1-12]KKI89529.1 DNA-3-methyladenine glycosylase [Bacillus sp. SA1-12]